MRAGGPILALALTIAGPAPAQSPARETAPVPRTAVEYSPAAVRAAVAESLPILWTAVDGHSEQRSCFTCHNHGVPVLAFTTARARGFDVPSDKLRDLVTFIADDLEKNRERFARGQGPGPSPAGGEADNTGYALLALAAAGYKPDSLTSVVVDYTLSRDKARGHWNTVGRRPPTEASHFTTTALCVLGLKSFAAEKQSARAESRVAASLAWLAKTPAADTEDRVFKLVGLKAAGSEIADRNRTVKELLDTQRADGGWPQTPELASDAYATGSVLYALHTAGGVPTTHPLYRRGLTFLLKTRAADGSWHVATRSRPVQRYFETGFPYGKDQFISAAATAWATTALALDVPAKE